MSSKMRFANHAHTAFLSVVALNVFVLAGCRLPDISGFASGVAATSAGVSETGTLFQAEADSLAALDPRYTDEADSLREHWPQRVQSLRSLSEYAASLDAIVQAGERGQESVAELTNAVSALTSAVGGPGIAGSAAAQIAGELGGLLATAAAAERIEQFVTLADPIIEKIIWILDQDLAAIESAVPTTANAAANRLVSDEYNIAMATRDALINEKLILASTIGPEDDEAQATRQTDSKFLAELAVLDEAIEDQAAIIRPVEREIAAVYTRYRALGTLIMQTRDSLAKVRVTHTQLAKAIRSNRTVSADSLRFAGERLLETVDSVKTILNEKTE